MAAPDDYDRGRECGRADYRAARDYDPGPGTQDWRIGYCDGWSAAEEEATATHGHALACQLAWGEGVAAYERRTRSR